MFNNLFIGVFGGDLYKVFGVQKRSGKFHAAVSVLYNRVINTYSIAVIPALFFIFLLNGNLLTNNKFVYYSEVASFILLIVLILLTIYNKKIISFISNKYEKMKNMKILLNFSIPKTIIISLIIQLMNISAHFCFAKALNINIDFISLLIIYSVSAVIISIPISINGIGVRESVFIYAFSFWSISKETAFAFSFLSFISIIFISILGGIIFIFENLNEIKNEK